LDVTLDLDALYLLTQEAGSVVGRQQHPKSVWHVWRCAYHVSISGDLTAVEQLTRSSALQNPRPLIIGLIVP
jgi:hypothetical protein